MSANGLRIEGEMTIYRANELKTLLVGAVGGSGTVEIDLSAVSEIDTAGVQLLMLAERVARDSRCTLHFARPSAAVREVLELLGRQDLTGWEDRA